MSTVSSAWANGYLVWYRNLQIENEGSLTICGKDKKRIAHLKGLSLWDPSSQQGQQALETTTCVLIRLDTAQILAEQPLLAHAIIASKNDSKDSPEIDAALSAIGIKKKDVQKFKISKSTFEDIQKALPIEFPMRSIAKIRFLLKDRSQEIEQLLQWTKKASYTYQEDKLSVLFERQTSRQISFSIRFKKEQIYPAVASSQRIEISLPKALPPFFPTCSSQPQTCLINNASFPMQLAHLHPPQRFSSLQSEITRPQHNVRTQACVTNVHIDDLRGVGPYLALSLPTSDVFLFDLALWKKIEVEGNLPEELREGLIEFSFRDQKFYLGAKSLIESMAKESKGSFDELQQYKKALLSVGIMQHLVFACVIDEVCVRKALREAEISDQNIDLLLTFLTDHHDELLSRLSWSTCNIKVRKDMKIGLPFTIRSERQADQESFRITLTPLGYSQGKITKKVLLLNSKESKILGMSRAKTKEEGKRLCSATIARAQKSISKEKEFSHLLFVQSVPFVRHVKPHFEFTRRGYCLKILHKLHPETLASRVQAICSPSHHERENQIIDLFPSLCGILESMQWLHDHKIYHFDIRLTNFIITSNADPQIFNFGRAKDLSKEELPIKTRIQGAIGNIAPECFHLPIITHPEAVDIFAFGAMWLGILRIQCPFVQLQTEFCKTSASWNESERAGWLDTFHRVISDTRDALRHKATNPHTHPIIGKAISLIEMCLDIDPSRRPKARDILSQLLEFPKVSSKYREMIARDSFRIDTM
jgi:serine/threonine protein kinase